MATGRLIMLVQRAKYVLQTEGLPSLIRKIYLFVTAFLIRYKTYYLYRDMLKARTRVDYLPKVKDFVLKIVYNNQQADELAAAGLECRYPWAITRDKLDKGAIAFCVFVEGKLAHRAWIAMTEDAKASLIALPFQVNFLDNEAYDGC